jgi:predicted phage baseplate assembly protein
MPLPAPHLDDRDFQSLVDDAKRMVQQRCPEWTDHNVSDPGVTLIETFAYMVDQLIYRLNQVPDRLYVQFLDLLGVTLEPPNAARAPVTFWLSAPQTQDVTVPAGSQVATRRTEDEPVVFTTLQPLAIVPCSFTRAATEAGGEQLERTESVVHGKGFPCFSTVPVAGDCFYVGLSNATPSCAVNLRLGCQVEGAGIDPRYPPLAWEAWDGAGWVVCEVDHDTTGGLNRDGDVLLHLPKGHRAHVGVVRQLAGWIRCRVVPNETWQPAYSASPRVTRIAAFTMGGTTDAVNAEIITDEVVGTSEGVPAQRFALRHHPVVPGGRRFGRQLDVTLHDTVERWEQVESFADSGPESRHFVIEPSTGEVVFGPAVRGADGELQCYGAVPPKDAGILIKEYRTGGGRRGNVARGAISVLKSSVPFIAEVTNRRPATGGTDGEDIENAKVRGPLALRTRHRAVTAEDYEYHAGAAAKEVARARCVAAGSDGVEAGSVRLLLVPVVEDGEHGSLRFEQLLPSPEVLERVSDHLDRRRPVGTRLVVQPVRYVGLTVVARMTAAAGADPVRVRADALEALHRHFHPVRGGLDGKGWPFGRSVVAGDVYAVLQRVPGVEVIDDIRLFPADAVTQTRDKPVERIDVGANDLVFGWGHQVRV